MRLREVLAAVAFSAPLTGCCMPEEHWHSQRLIVPADPDAELAALIDACVTDLDCDPLCLDAWGKSSWAQDPEWTDEVRDCTLTITQGEAVLTYDGLTLCVAGRRPARYATRLCAARTRTGTWLAHQAQLEAASVRAFVDLHADLVAHRAPRSLRRAALAAARDEVRHARVCALLARRYGAQVALAATPAAPRATLRRLAIDNAVEGCVRETYGAVEAGYQARAAGDPAIRSTMAVIARDEARHAELAWRIAAWLAPRLAPVDRAAVAAHERAARAELAATAGTDDAELATVAGVPDRATAAQLLAALDARVFAAVQ